MCVWYHGTYVLHIGQVSCLIYVAHILKVQSKLGLEYGQAPSDENEGEWIEMLWSCSYIGSLCISKKEWVDSSWAIKKRLRKTKKNIRRNSKIWHVN